MRLSFHPRLINPPFGDPGIFIPFTFENRAFIFDMGDMYSLSPRDILKTSHIFISHTHMDHFSGFDRLLRLFLGREKELYLYGPPGFLKNVEGKTAGYSWNLVGNYSNRFSLNVSEVHTDHILSCEYLCRNKFIPEKEPVQHPFNGTLLQEPSLSISAAILDHGIPCMGFSLQERFHVNIIKDRLKELGLDTGPWLNRFKQALFSRQDPDTEFEIFQGRENPRIRKFILGELTEAIVIITPGQKITYVADAVYSPPNIEKILSLAKDSDYLFIEAAFLDADKETAYQKLHLTARQAGTLAGRAGVRMFTIFHFSPRYTGMENLLYNEALDAYKAAIHEG